MQRQEQHPGKKHIRIHCPASTYERTWAEQNAERVRIFLLQVTVGRHNQYLDVYYEPGQETLIIEEVLRYAGVIDVCRLGSYLD